MAPVGRTKDSGWQIGVSRTVHRPLDEVWSRLVSDDVVAVWLGAGVSLPLDVGADYETVAGTAGQVRSYRPGDRIRLTWRPEDRDHETTVQLAVAPTSTGTTIRFHQERMADADERERQRTHWRAVMDRLVAMIDP